MSIRAKVSIVWLIASAWSICASGTAQAQSRQFILTYSGPTVSGNILLTATANGDGTFTVGAASGSQTFNNGTQTVTGLILPNVSYPTQSKFYIGDTSSYFGYDDVLTPATSPVLDGGGLLLNFNGVPYPVLIFYDSSGKYGDGIGYQEGFYVGSDGNDLLDSSFTDYPITSLTLTPVVPPIAAVEFTQAIQQYQTLTDLEASLEANDEPPVPIISGKPAVMRVYFNPVQDVTIYTVQVTGAIDESKALYLVPDCAPADQRGRLGPCSSMDFYFSPPVGAWTVNLSVTDPSGNVVEQEALNFISRNTQTLHLISASVCDSMDANGNWLCGLPTDLLGREALLTQIMPTNSVVFDAGTDTAMINELAPNVGFDKWLDLSVAVVNTFYGPLDRISDAANNSHTLHFGSYRTIVGSTGISVIGGRGAMSPAFVPRLGVDATDAVVAHETGHTLTLRHTNILNSVVLPPTGPPPGCYNIAEDNQTDWPFLNNDIQDFVGNGVTALEWGFDVASQAVLDPTQTFELMSYCSPRWISPLRYTTVLSVLGGGPVTLPSVVRASRPARDDAAPPKVPELLPLTYGSYTQVSGMIGSGGVTFNPLFTNTINGTADPGSGTYSIVVQNSLGQPIYTRYFTPYAVETDVATGPDLSFDPVFSEWIPNVAGAASIIVEDPNGASIGSLTLTGTAPNVTLVSPGTGFKATGPQPVTWTVSPACASCTARILYSSNDGATWSQIGQIQGSTTVMINFSGLPGSTAGGSLIQVLVSDGINTGSATSALFSVAKSPPTIVQIDSPQPGYSQAAADTIQLIGEAYDPDDGMLHGSHLVWSSNVQGTLGSGSPLAAKLQAGAHTITLTATDSDGNSLTAATNVIMGGAGPVVTLSTSALATGCVSATIAATPGANQGAALSSVQYSLNGGANYTSVPLTQLPYSFVIPGVGTVNLVAVASDISRQIAAQSAVANIASACTTGVPSVSGGSTQVATVDATFSTPLSALVTNNNGNPVPGVAVNFTAPANGASATLSASTSTTNANGIASVTATANGNNGSYEVLATVPGFSTTAQFSLTNTDFSLSVNEPSLTVMDGSSGTATISVTPLSGFSSSVTLACTGLPEGAACSFSPASLTPAGAALTSTVTVTTSALYATFTPGRFGSRRPSTRSPLWWLGVLALATLLAGVGIAGIERMPLRRWAPLAALILLIVMAGYLVGCMGGFPRAALPGGTPTGTYSIAVTATSGADAHSTTVMLTVQ
jgi:hypothetical protein